MNQHQFLIHQQDEVHQQRMPQNCQYIEQNLLFQIHQDVYKHFGEDCLNVQYKKKLDQLNLK